MYAEHSLDVEGPAVSLETFMDRPQLSSPLGNAVVQKRRDFTHGLSADPAVFPEQRFVAIANFHGSGGEE
jgi:hypothetical protein